MRAASIELENPLHLQVTSLQSHCKLLVFIVVIVINVACSNILFTFDSYALQCYPGVNFTLFYSPFSYCNENGSTDFMTPRAKLGGRKITVNFLLHRVVLNSSCNRPGKNMAINCTQRDVEVFCVSLVSFKVTVIYEINDPRAKYENLEKSYKYDVSGLALRQVCWFGMEKFKNNRDKMK